MRVSSNPTRIKDAIPATVAASQAQFPTVQAAILAQTALAQQAANAYYLIPAARFSDGGWMASPTLTTAGSPLFVKSSNKRSARLIKTNQVWPAAAGGSILPGLTGTGRTMLMWDGGADGLPYTQHPEFLSGGVSRISTTTGLLAEFHSSAAAGTLAAAGLDPEARGMAFNAKILAQPQSEDLSNLTNQTLAQLQQRRVSNHSYGLDHGWTYTVADWTGAVEVFLSWEGDLALSQTESNFNGLYTAASRSFDAQGYEKPYFQQVYAAGNQRQEGPNSAYSLIDIGAATSFYTSFYNGSLGLTNLGLPGVTSAVFYKIVIVPGGLSLDPPVFLPSNLAPLVDGGTTGFDTLSDRAVLKNALIVGSVDENRALNLVDTATAHGPTDDGRMKPDVVAKGVDIFTTDDTGSYASVAGSSFASPAVAGSAHLISFRHEDLWGPREPMRSSTLRALISMTADDVVVTSADPALAVAAGPDYKTGWGTMDTAEAVTTVNANHAATYNGVKMRPFIKEVFIPDGGELDFNVKAVGGIPVKVCAAWTDPAGDAQATNLLDPTASRLVNDLDLTVTRTLTGGSTQTFKPWRLDPANPAAPALRTYSDSLMNFRDNIEVVETTSVATANQVHRIRLKQKSLATPLRQVDPLTGNLITGGQWVSLTLSGVQQSNIDFVITSFEINFSGGQVDAKLTWNAVVGQTYRIQTSLDLLTWVDNSGNILPLGETVTANTVPLASGGTRFWRVAAVAPNPFNLP